MKLIDADEAFRVLSDYYHHRTETQADALREALELVPEAVVRCRDCDQYDFDYEHKGWCNACCFVVDERHYCSYGERR